MRCILFRLTVFLSCSFISLGLTRNGIAPAVDLAPTWPAAGPPIVWQRKVGAGFAGPVVSGVPEWVCVSPVATTCARARNDAPNAETPWRPIRTPVP
jgi:hypothetical protein